MGEALPLSAGAHRSWATPEIGSPAHDQRHSVCGVHGLPMGLLSHEYPPWQIVYDHFRKWQKNETWFVIHQALHQDVWKHAGKAPEPTVAIIDSQYDHFRKWQKNETWFVIHQALHQDVWKHAGKAPEPTVAIIDSQSVKMTELAATRGFDGHKKVKGRQRHIVIDTLGLLLVVVIHDVNLPDGK